MDDRCSVSSTPANSDAGADASAHENDARSDSCSEDAQISVGVQFQAEPPFMQPLGRPRLIFVALCEQALRRFKRPGAMWHIGMGSCLCKRTRWCVPLGVHTGVTLCE